MIDLLNSLALVVLSVGMVTVAGGLLWCWLNRSRLYNGYSRTLSRK
ncbi:MAG: hypothetical protein WBN81_04200 [Gammaproteobacteria bacterium]